MIALIVTIVVIVVIASVFIVKGSDLPGEALYTRFVQEVTSVESAIYENRLQNAKYGDSEEKLNAGFEKVILFEAPADFVSFNPGEGLTSGYLINLETISYMNAEFGQEYTTTERTFTFGKDDVYVYDATGSVFYVKGIVYKKTRVYSLASASALDEDSTQDGPIISNVVVTSGELSDGTKTNAKAKILISAFPRNEGELTVLVRNNKAEKVEGATGTYATQVQRNGTYSIVVSEANGGRTVTQVTVSGIAENVEPPSNLSMIINEGSPTTQSKFVNIDLRADGATYMMITKDNATKPSSRDENWQRYQSNFEYDLGNTEGKITLYAWFKDDLNNVATTIVQASILYDGTAPTDEAPTLTQSGPYIIVSPNQTDRLATDDILMKNMEYGYAEYDGTNAGEFTWGRNSVIMVPKNKQVYVFATKTKDEAGNETISKYSELYINYDFIIEFRLEPEGEVYNSMISNAGDVVTLPVDIPELLGYKFVGWSEDPYATNNLETAEIISAGGNYLPPDDGTLIKKLYAAWAPRTDIPYTVKHYVEKLGATNEYEVRVEEKLEGTTGNDVVAVAKTTDDFVGLVENLAHPSRVAMAKIQVDGSTVLSLYYTRLKNDLTVTAENGAATGTTKDVTYESLVKIANTPDEGYEFSRWVIDGVADDSKEYQSFVNLNGVYDAYATFKMLGIDTTLIAKNVPKNYNITYYLDGGTVAVANPEKYSRISEPFTLNNPTKTGYNFAGWQGTGIIGTQQVVTIDPTQIDIMSDRAYYAIYEPAPELLTMEASPITPTNDIVKVKVNCLDPQLVVQYKIGELGTWENYITIFTVDENLTVYARAMRDGILIDEEQMVINNIDRKAPVINSLTVADSWVAGNILKMKISATDETGMGTYLITDTNTEPPKEEFYAENEIEIAGNGINYAWARDLAGNTTSLSFYVWDISKTSNETMYAILVDSKHLIIAGSGATEDYADENSVPFYLYKDAITSVAIDEGVTKIGNYVLAEMTNLKTISISSSLQTMSDKALKFSNVFENIVIDSNNRNFTYDNYTLYDMNKTRIYSHSNYGKLQFFTIPSTVTDINSYAFYNNNTILKLTSGGNPNVGESTFESMDRMFEITGTIGGTTISDRAFADCRELETITISDTLETIGINAFLNTVKVEKISIPKSIQFVGSEDTSINGVFKNFGLYTVTGKGAVEYYQSSTPIHRYATAYADEANFVMIDDVSPTLLSLTLTAPEAGEQAQGTEIIIEAEYDEKLSTSHADGVPTLIIKFGTGSNKTVTTTRFENHKIIYTYPIESDDEGTLSLVSYKGKVYDVLDNATNIDHSTLLGNEIIANTMVKLEDRGIVTYYTTLQAAIDSASSRPETASIITVLKDLNESVIIEADKYIEIDMNEKTLTSLTGNQAVINNGKVTIRNAGTITSDALTIINQGSATLALDNIKLISTSTTNPTIVVSSGAKLDMVDTTLEGEYRAIENNGQVTIATSVVSANVTEAIISTYDSIINIKDSTISSNATAEESSTIRIADGATGILENTDVTAENNIAIINAGRTEIKGTGTINGPIGIDNEGDLILTGQTISNSTAGEAALINDGTVELNGATITSAEGVAIVNSDKIDFISGTVSSTSTTGDTITNKAGATLNVSGGYISSANTIAIDNSGTLTLSENAMVVSSGTETIVNTLVGTVNISGGIVEQTNAAGTAIANDRHLNITGGTIKTKGKYGIINTEFADLTASNMILEGENTSAITGIQITSTTESNISNSEINVTTSAGDANGIYIEGIGVRLHLDTTVINVTSTNGMAYGIQNKDAEVTVGNSETIISTATPLIDGGTYGYYSESGTLNYYDGKFVGAIDNALYGTVTNRPEGSYVKYTVENSREYTMLILDAIKPTVSLEADITTWTNQVVTLTGKASDADAGVKAYAFTNTILEPEASEWIYLTEAEPEMEQTLEVREHDNFYFHVMDEAGNTAVSNLVIVYYDDVAPVIEKIEQVPTNDIWTQGPATVTVYATDFVSKVGAYEITETYRPSGDVGNYTVISGVEEFTRSITSGNTTWHIYIKDQAGNVSYAEWTVENIDLDAPTIKVDVVSQEPTVTYVKIEAEDLDSGMSAIYVNGILQTDLDSKSGDKIIKTYAIEASGIYTVKALDNVGNESFYDINVYSVSYDKNGGNGVVTSQIKVQGTNLQIAENTFVRDGYSFMHWNTKADNTGTTYNPGDMYSVDESVVLYAIWKDITKPEILDVKLSSTWQAGQTFVLHVEATDNLAPVKYQITDGTAPVSWTASPEVDVTTTATDLTVWVADAAGNIASGEFNMYDLSKSSSTKTVVGIVKDFIGEGTKLSIEGSGVTNDYTLTNVPWFDKLADIEYVEVKEGVQGLGKYILSNMNNVKEIVLEKTVKSIDITAFVHTNNFDEIVVEGDNFDFIDGVLYNKEKTNLYVSTSKSTVAEITTPSTLTTIAPYAFENSLVEKITIFNNIDIPEGAFINAANLRVIITENGIGGKTIGTSAFEGCLVLKDLDISKELETLGSRAFYDCRMLTDIIIPKTLKTINGDSVFVNIGSDADTNNVYYYESNTTMVTYATNYSTQATFIPIDDIVPTITKVVINDNAEYTRYPEVTLTITAGDNHEIEYIYVTEDATYVPTGIEQGWIPYEVPQPYTLKTGNGTKQLYVWVKDAEDNVSTNSATDSIILVEYNFELIGREEVVQYVDTTGKDYYIYRERGYNYSGEGVSIATSGTVNHKAVGTYELKYNIMFENKVVATHTRNVKIINDSWNTEVFTDGDYQFVTHSTEPYAKIVAYDNISGATHVSMPTTLSNGTEYTVIDIGDGTNMVFDPLAEINMVTLPESAINVSANAFKGARSLMALDYADALMSIRENAFSNINTTFEKVTLKNNVRVVYPNAFYNTKVKNIVIEDGLYEIGASAFECSNSGSTTGELLIPASVVNIGKAAFYGVDFNRIIVDATNTTYKEIYGKYLANKAGNTVYKYATGNSDQIVTIPEGVTTFEYGAFAEGNYIKKVEFNGTETTIGEKAFKDNSYLSELVNMTSVVTIGNYAFQNSGLTSIEIPTTLNTIGDAAFMNTKLSKVSIPSSVTKIGSKAFGSITTFVSAVFEGTPQVAGDAFVSSAFMKHIIALDTNNIISLTSALEVAEGVNVYVMVPETRYESDANWSVIGAERIKTLAQLVGNEEIYMEHGTVYTEEGILLIDEPLRTGEGTSSYVSDFKATKKSTLDVNIVGDYTITYTIHYKEQPITQLIRYIHVIDIRPPEITSMEVLDGWVSGTPLEIVVSAVDDYDPTPHLQYAVSDEDVSGDVTKLTWSSSNIVSVVGETTYVYAKDTSNNMAYVIAKAWDISKNSDKTVYAFINMENKLTLTGRGETKDIGYVSDTPWEVYNSDITEIEIQEGMTHLGKFILSGMEAVETITIPSTVHTIAEDAFAMTNNFDTLNVSADNTYFMCLDDYSLYNGTGTILYMHGRKDVNKVYTLENTVTKIASYAFYRNDNLTSINTRSLFDIGEYAFAKCTNLKLIPGNDLGVTSIGDGVFEDDYALGDITISKTVTTIGTRMFINVKGPVYYYASCKVMKEYVKTYPDETEFILIDDVPPTDDAPTLKASSSTIVATLNQYDVDTPLTSIKYMIRPDYETYEGTYWQDEPYFLNLNAEEKYYVKTKVTDSNNNTTESQEAIIYTTAVPDNITLIAMPTSPVNDQVTVVVEWPENEIEALYGSAWPAETDVTKQVGVQKLGETSKSWSDADRNSAKTNIIVTDYGTTVYARLFDGTNYTAKNISLTVYNIDKIPPEGTVVINNGDEETLDQDVTLTLSATDDRTEEGYGVKWFFASEQANPDLTNAAWVEYTGNPMNYTFNLDPSSSSAARVATVNVWYKDAAQNISEKTSDTIILVSGVARLVEGSTTTYHATLKDAINTASDESPTNASKITLLRNIQQEGTLNAVEGQNILLEMNGKVITQTSNSSITAIKNGGILAIRNAEGATASNITVTTTSGNAVGIYNTGLLDIDDVSVIVTAPSGTSMAIHNENIK